MKQKLLLTFTVALLNLSLWAQTSRPDWVKQHPVNELGFAGVGMAKVSGDDYQQKAKRNALADLVSEIKVEIATNSLLNTIEKDDVVQQTFTESIRVAAQEEIENFRMVSSWQGDGEYWVYYELGRADYEAFMEARRQKAIRNGFDFWYKGNVLLEQGDLMTGIDLLSKGMDAIRPVLNQELLCSYEGKTINLATELYSALTGVFGGVAIVLNPTTVGAIPFQGIKDPIAVGIYRNGNPLKNVRLEAKFVSGSGDLSELSPTDETGVAALYVRNVTSKQAQQQVQVSMVDDVFQSFRKGSYAGLFKQILATLPGATLTINTAQQQVSAYVKSVQSDMDMLERSVKSLLTNNFFNVAASPSVADVTVTLDNKCRKGNIVQGELYNFVEFFSSLGIKVTDNRTGQILLNYSINDERTLVPENKASSQGKNMAARELIKRLNREFNRELKKITFDRTGDIPQVKTEPDTEPVVVPVIRKEEPKPVVTPAIPIVIPEVVPAPAPAPATKPVTEQSGKTIRAEWSEGLFLEFNKITTLGNKSKIHLKVINTNADDYKLDIYTREQIIVNEKGEEEKIVNLKLGSKSSDYYVSALIVPNLPTELVIEVGQLESVALLQLKNSAEKEVKLRNLK